MGSKGFSISRESDFNVSARVLIFNLARKPKSEVIYKKHLIAECETLSMLEKELVRINIFLVKCIQEENLSAIFFVEDIKE